MRHGSLIGGLAALLLLGAGCKGASQPAPSKTASADVQPAAPPKATPRSVVQPVHGGSSPGDAPSPDQPPVAPAPGPPGAQGPPAPAARSAGGADGAGAPRDGDATSAADAREAGPRGDDRPRPSEELCAKACAHALKLSLAELPKDARPGVRESLRAALDKDCPRQCRERATPASATCVLQAKTARALADCPH